MAGRFEIYFCGDAHHLIHHGLHVLYLGPLRLDDRRGQLAVAFCGYAQDYEEASQRSSKSARPS